MWIVRVSRLRDSLAGMGTATRGQIECLSQGDIGSCMREDQIGWLSQEDVGSWIAGGGSGILCVIKLGRQ